MKKLVKIILLWTNIFIALLLVLAYASNIISPAKIWILAFFGLIYPFSLIINLFFILFWVWREKIYFLISLVIIILGWGNINRYLQFNPKKSDQSDSENQLKVLSYNVRIFNYYRWERLGTVRDSIINFVKDQNPDIICFQEFHSNDLKYNESEEFIKKKLGPDYSSHIFYRLPSVRGGNSFGLATFTNKTIIHQAQIHFQNSVNFAIYTDIVDKPDTFRVYNVHLQSISLDKNRSFTFDSLRHINNERIEDMRDISSRLRDGFIKRSEQADILAAHISDSPYPVILCGDFNDTPVSYTYHTLLGNLKDSFRTSGSGVGKTYRGNFPSYRIDYIFHSKEFDSKEFRTIPLNHSDHLPIFTFLKYSEKGGD